MGHCGNHSLNTSSSCPFHTHHWPSESDSFRTQRTNTGSNRLVCLSPLRSEPACGQHNWCRWLCHFLKLASRRLQLPGHGEWLPECPEERNLDCGSETVQLSNHVAGP